MTAVDDVKARLDIVEVIGGYVRLQKAGRYFKGLCPFHTEKTPSFVVYPDRQSWHCFGACGTGGDVLAFMSRKENLDFSSTLRLMADRAGVELRNDGPRREEIKTLQDANEAAALFFHGLLPNTPAARAYIDERGLDSGAVGDFQIGYAPPGWDSLRNHLTSRGFAEAQLIEAGLIIESDRGGYDRFRDRLMFPIRDDRGRVVGFGGRILPGSKISTGAEAGPKYMNTPQTPIFDKGGVLYAFDRAKDAIRSSNTAVIVEGYMDVIAAHQHGFRNVVASMGTALTDKQATLVRVQAERVVLAMDADEAGKAANLRAVQVVAASAERPARATSSGRAIQRHLDVRVLALPLDKDPDELIRREPDAWTNAVETAAPVIDHFYKVTTAGRDLNDPRERQAMIDEMLPFIAELRSNVEQASWVQRISRGRAREDDLWRQIRTLRRGGATQRRAAATSDEAATVSKLPIASAAKEEFCLALLYRIPTIAPAAAVLHEDLFSLSENRELFRRWRAGISISEEDDGLWEHYQDVLQTRIAVTETAQAEEAFLDCVERLEGVKLKAVKEASALALAEGVAGVRPGQVVSLARARLGVGTTEEIEVDEQTNAAVDLFLEDNKINDRLHRSAIERSRSDQAGKRST